MGNRDYYDIMGLAPDADGAMVEQQYWALAKTYNASDDAGAQSQLNELNEAYGVLGTPRLREQYDAFRLDVEIARKGGTPRVRAARAPGRGLLGGWRFPGLGKRSAPKFEVQPSMAAETAATRAATQRSDQGREAVAAHTAPAAVAERAGRSRRGGLGTQDLRESTAAMLGRWRENIATRGGPTAANGDPDATLVEIFQNEEAVDEPEEPLTAALDVLRGSKPPQPE